MPKGYPNTKTAPAAAAVVPAPMVLIEPAPDGAIRLNAYGLDGGEIVEVLRRSLLHLVALRAGMQVISVEVPARAAIASLAVVTASKAPSKAIAKPSVNGRHYAREMKRDVAVAESKEADE